MTLTKTKNGQPILTGSRVQGTPWSDLVNLVDVVSDFSMFRSEKSAMSVFLKALFVMSVLTAPGNFHPTKMGQLDIGNDEMMTESSGVNQNSPVITRKIYWLVVGPPL